MIFCGGIDSRRRKVGWLAARLLVVLLAVVPLLHADDGDLDPTFSGDGVTTLGVASVRFAAQGVAVQTDGKIVAVGFANGQAETADLAVVRYNPDGALDTGFASGGLFTASLGDYGSSGEDVVIQPDGRIVVAGTAIFNLGGASFTIVRLTDAGSLDTSFSTDGIKFVSVSGSSQGHALALQPDGGIVVVGETSSDSGIAVARLTGTGALDSTFDGDGTAVYDFAQGDDEGWDVAIQDNGRIVVVGNATVVGNSMMVTMRLLSNGSLDTTFGVGGGGAQAIDFGDASFGRGVALQPDGKIVVAGSTDASTAIAVARLGSNGQLDTTFSGDGKVTRDFVYGPDEGWDVALQGDGRIIAVGSGYIDGLHQVAIVRFTADGAPDPSLGGYGYRLVSLASDARGRAVVVQPGDRKVVVAGFKSLDADTTEIAVLRVVGDAGCVFVDGFECGTAAIWSTEMP